ncbi:hypothetical protein GCK72_017051 [Caenorhabditis remanei]|uniref:Uncharacterized protein n=1 Tax=Caenorhabditis remanei TaxID=31234 RepID=A0A6A5G703_CAERE|nr:hypothetical protein GCK72_017051 [Caenorhabditis remanei]KAF1750501.1 hypothetical protein GCK72_017051 [Caenorhabditis remanei]
MLSLFFSSPPIPSHPIFDRRLLHRPSISSHPNFSRRCSRSSSSTTLDPSTLQSSHSPVQCPRAILISVAVVVVLLFSTNPEPSILQSSPSPHPFKSGPMSLSVHFSHQLQPSESRHRCSSFH